jgi:hypothetical protein
VDWLSTEAGSTITVTLDGALSDGLSHSISAADVSLLKTDGVTDTMVGTLEATRVVKDITTWSDSQMFKLQVHVPSAAAGTYTGTLTFDVFTPTP